MHDREPVPARPRARLVGGLTTHIVEATAAYEAWLAEHTAVVAADIDAKHTAMASDPFVFLRATAYRWAARLPKVCPDAADAPRLVAVGDLHIENFGTWRDIEGRLVWGINDVDEAAEMPYTNDLVRLVTSTVVAKLAIGVAEAAQAVLEGYTAGATKPFVLAEDHLFLRDLAARSLKDPDRFWAKLTAGLTADATNPEVSPHARHALPAGAGDVITGHRVAGVGSLGRARTVAAARLDGAWVAREAKAIVPSSWAPDVTEQPVMTTLLAAAVRAPDPTWQPTDGWLVRRLAPDCSRIELADLPTERDEHKLLHAMGAETANVHRPGPDVAADLTRRPKGWLATAAKAMADDVIADHADWVKHRVPR